MKKKILSLALIFAAFAVNAQTPMEYAERMAQSEMKRNPEVWMADFAKKLKWDYTQGLMAKTMIELWKATGNETYYTYAKGLVDQFIEADGKIKTYKLSDYNIDRVNPGKALFEIYYRDKDPKVKTAIDTLRSQLRSQPRVDEGGFWHKKIYPWQMWLDGLYMGSPFYAEYIQNFGTPDEFADVVKQFTVAHKHTLNLETGLNHHAWDEKKEQPWADKVTGRSPESWGRAMGWYAMALVDVLDFIPADRAEDRAEILRILQDVAKAIKNTQQPSGVWYQVLSRPNEKGNYEEATVSCMFTYAIEKAVRMNYIDKSYLAVAQKGYDGIIKNFIQENDDKTISLTRCCAVAGLGGTPYRSGTFDYYVNETIRDNDPKGVGPFILMCIEMAKN
ncbi:MAG: glycoside hydrolase family 88 protein [Bacteroidales bacterium]|jgi:unsaturated rhamnogalacturonyl hydrolase|nr:glycoside hydrolase family 88 protein [Bacteroidales bacterium]